MSEPLSLKLLSLLGGKSYVPSTSDQLAKQLRVSPRQQKEFTDALRSAEAKGQIVRTKNGRFIKAREADLIAGTIRVNRQGRGFVRPDEPGLPEVVVPESATSTALDQDRVLVRLDVVKAPTMPPAERTGAVVRILERKRKIIVGTLQRSEDFLYVIPDDPRLPHDIYVPLPRDVGRPARVGDKVVVELRNWESRHTNPEGQVIEVLGAPDEEGVDLLSVIRQYQLPLHFPADVLAEAEAIVRALPQAEPSAGEIASRVDCTKHQVITIDPEDAKDFDDAICLERVGQDRWRLWVHIADVSHYVRPGSRLDAESEKRGNSTYLVDRVIPMLPEALSNELCSLKPGVARLTKCVEFLLSANGEVLGRKLYSAVIRSQHRFNYGEVLSILQRAPATPLERLLHQANQLAQKLRQQRFRTGALDLDFPEMKIILDEAGRISRLDRVASDASHQLIEEFMLLANEAVAVELWERRRPAVHRVHEPPDERRLREFRQDVLSHRLPCGNLSQRPEVQRLLHRLGQSPLGPALKIGFLRSLKRARYDVKPLGHYGLNKKDYAHFTSPIRRYADLVVHRALFEKSLPDTQSLQRISDHISETERNSSDAERDSKEVKLFAFLTAQLRRGQPVPYPALVTDVRNFGFFVDVSDLGLSGLVHLSSVEDDFYVFDAARTQLIGRRSRRVIRLGDRISVRVRKVDTFKKQVDFELARLQGKPQNQTRERDLPKRGERRRGSGATDRRQGRNRTR
jgi:ribonuclease R